MARLGYDENGNIVGISTYDVARAIGASSLDVGTLCTNGNIKKWSKDKPMHVIGKPTELTEADKRKANYGLDMGNEFQRTIGQQYLGGVVFDGDKSVETLRNELTLWKYEDAVNENSYGRPVGGKWDKNYPNSEADRLAHTSWYRLSDFHGYNHDANPIVCIDDNFRLVDDSYELTLNVSTSEGGLTLWNFNPLAHLTDKTGNDDNAWNMMGWYASIFVVSDNSFKIGTTINGQSVYGVGANVNMNYLIGVQDAGTGEVKTTTVHLPKKALDHLMGKWYVCVMLVPKEINYKKGNNSFDVGINSDYIAYPEIVTDDVGTKGVFVENAIMELNFPDGNGVKLWEQEWKGEGGMAGQYNYVYDGKLMSSLTLDADVAANTNGDIRFANSTTTNASRGFKIELNNQSVDSLVKRKFRSIVMFNNLPYVSGGFSNDTNNYLTYDNNSGEVYKPLLRGVGVLNTTDNVLVDGTADFYLKFYTVGSTRHQAVVMKMSMEGSEHTLFSTEQSNAGSMFVGQIEFQNIVNVFTNRPEGFRVKVWFGAKGSTNIIADSRHPVLQKQGQDEGGLVSIISTVEGENNNNGGLSPTLTYTPSSGVYKDKVLCPFIYEDYSIDCHLPDGKKQSVNGGGLYVLYDVTSDNYNS